MAVLDTAAETEGTTAPSIAVRLLGPVEVSVNGRVVKLRKRPAGVLAILLTSQSRSMDCEQIADLLYDGDPIREYRAAIRGYLSEIRKLDGTRDLVPRTRSFYALLDGAFTSDIDQFETLVRRGRYEAERRSFASAAAAFEQALALWRGQPFDDLREAAYFDDAGRTLAPMRLLVEEELVDAQLALGLHHQVADRVDALARERPEREVRWRQLMLALHRCGRHHEASDAYQRAYAELAEIGIEPSSALRELNAAIVRQSPTLDVTWEAPRPGVPIALARDRGGFVGRRALLDQLCGPGGHVSVIVGAGGSGKSTLLAETVRRLSAGPNPPVVAYGACDPTDDLPLQPVLRAFRWASDRPMPRPDAIVASELMNASAPLLVVLDDIHLADEATLAFVRHAARVAMPTHVRVIVAARPDSSLPSLEIPGVFHIDLGPFDDLDLNEFIASKGSGSEFTVEQLRAITGGWPILLRFADELIRHGTPLSSVSSLSLPERAITAISRALALLGERERSTLAAAAALGGERIDIDHVAAVTDAGRSLRDIRSDLGAAAAIGLVRPSPWRFGHGVIAEAIVDGIPPSELEALRHRIATTDSLPVEARARAALRSIGVLDEPTTRALAANARDAARAARRHHLVVELARLERVLFDDLGRLGDPDRFELLVEEAMSLESSGRREPAEDCWEEALRIAERNNDLSLAARVAGRPPALGRSISPMAIIGQLERAIALGGTNPSPDEQRMLFPLLAERAALDALTGHSARAEMLSNSLFDTVPDGDPELRISALHAWLYASFRPADRQRRFDRSTTLWQATPPSHRLRLDAATLHARSQIECGDLAGAEQTVHLIPGEPDADSPLTRWASLIAKSAIATASGAFTLAASSAATAAELANHFDIGDGALVPYGQAFALRLLHAPEHHVRLVEPANATLLGGGLIGPRRPEETATRATTRNAFGGLICALAGQHDEAATALRLSSEAFVAGANDLFSAPCAAMVIEICWILQTAPPAPFVESIRSFGDSLTILGLSPSVILGPATRQHALAAVLCGDPDYDRLFEAAVERCNAAGAHAWSARTLSDWATARARFGHDNWRDLADRAATVLQQFR